jgi:hypothetical protein
MKKFILILILSLIGIICIAQSKFQATHYTVALPDTINPDTLIWTEWESTDVIILITEKKINIYSNFEQEYIPISGKVTILSKDKDSIEFEAIDILGGRVTIELVHWKTGEHQIYISWPNLAICYLIKKL